MRLKKQSDYALRVLMYLAANNREISTVKDIALFFDISQNHLMKVVQGLSHLGYVRTVRGKNGGIWLDQPTEAINIGAVLRQVGEENELAECFVEHSQCRIERVCKLKQILRQANDAFFAVLDEFSLADILASPSTLEALLVPSDLSAV